MNDDNHNGECTRLNATLVIIALACLIAAIGIAKWIRQHRGYL